MGNTQLNISGVVGSRGKVTRNIRRVVIEALEHESCPVYVVIVSLVVVESKSKIISGSCSTRPRYCAQAKNGMDAR